MSNLYSIPSNSFDPPYVYRFLFVSENSSFDEAYIVQVSRKIHSIRKAFYIACETYLEYLTSNKIKVRYLSIYLKTLPNDNSSDNSSDRNSAKLYKVYSNFNYSDKSDYDYFHL